jgi:hypothetical protein
MAIIDKLPGLKVTVVVNGEALPEYPDVDGAKDAIIKLKSSTLTVSPDKQSSTFVECVSDTEFKISIEVGPPYSLGHEYDNITFWATIDGSGIGGRSIAPARFQYREYCSTIEEVRNRINAEDVSYRKLQFRGLVKVDDKDSARVQSDVKLAQGLGEIVVHAHRVVKSNVLKKSTESASKPQRDAVSEISEKALKGRAVSHGVG